jgi:hypothetical protein
MKRGFVFQNTVSERGLSGTEGDSAGQRPRPGSNRMTVVSALDDPLAVFLTDDLPDVMAPDDNRADRRTTGVAAVMSPGSRKVVLRTGISPNLTAHVPAAPGGRPSPAHAPIARAFIARIPISLASLALINRTLVIRVPKAGPEAETKAGVPKPLRLLPVMPVMVAGIVPIMVVMSSRFRARCKSKKHRTRGKDSTHTVFLVLFRGRDRVAIKGRVISADHPAAASTMGVPAAHLGQPPLRGDAWPECGKGMQ